MGSAQSRRLLVPDREKRQVDRGLSGSRRKRTSRNDQGQYRTLGGKGAARQTRGFGGCLRHTTVIVRNGVILAVGGVRIRCITLLLVTRADRG